MTDTPLRPDDQVTRRDRYQARTAILAVVLGAALTTAFGVFIGGDEWRERAKEIQDLRHELRERTASVETLKQRFDAQAKEMKDLRVALNARSSRENAGLSDGVQTDSSLSSVSGDEFENDVTPCRGYLPRGGLGSPPSYGDFVLGGDKLSMDGRIVDIDLENRRVAVDVELPRGIGITTIGIDAATKVFVRCVKGSRENLKCGHHVRVVRVGGSAAAVVVIHDDDKGRQLPCEIRY